jgi:hypothetical protein
MLIILILGESISTVKKETDTLLVDSKNIGLEENGEKITCSTPNIYKLSQIVEKAVSASERFFAFRTHLCPVLETICSQFYAHQSVHRESIFKNFPTRRG